MDNQTYYIMTRRPKSGVASIVSRFRQSLGQSTIIKIEKILYTDDLQIICILFLYFLNNFYLACSSQK